ncbi:hypothetical protein DYL72_21855 (plasmid) [Vibrio anguillarum]|uniref:Uncharacterized protein n=1 Tax=Vibrio anguillarum TaxID=55601 RepID=A0A7U6FUF4_VIBAN|nr:hypothetical protein [Vibrio anguillarum]AZS27556.1 hypothetical protein DYL72_21855 [Vibrio anguillarum]
MLGITEGRSRIITVAGSENAASVSKIFKRAWDARKQNGWRSAPRNKVAGMRLDDRKHESSYGPN